MMQILGPSWKDFTSYRSEIIVKHGSQGQMLSALEFSRIRIKFRENKGSQNKNVLGES